MSASHASRKVIAYHAFEPVTTAVSVSTWPAGTLIWYNTWLLQMLDPALWDGDTSGDLPRHMDWRNNLEGIFQPERWLGEEAKRPRASYVFGGGAHLCAGMLLVQMVGGCIPIWLGGREQACGDIQDCDEPED